MTVDTEYIERILVVEQQLAHLIKAFDKHVEQEDDLHKEILDGVTSSRLLLHEMQLYLARQKGWLAGAVAIGGALAWALTKGVQGVAKLFP